VARPCLRCVALRGEGSSIWSVMSNPVAHVQPGRRPTWGDPMSGDEDVGSGSGSQTQDRLTRAQVRDRDRVRYGAAERSSHSRVGGTICRVGPWGSAPNNTLPRSSVLALQRYSSILTSIEPRCVTASAQTTGRCRGEAPTSAVTYPGITRMAPRCRPVPRCSGHLPASC
jgi:hypothetical protein